MRFTSADSHTELRELRFGKFLRRHCPTAKNFDVSLRDVFVEAARAVETVTSTAGILGGTPCIRGTRVPVYMVLDAVEHYGTLKGALRSYPQLSESQVKEAVRFAKLVMERPVDNKTENSY
jgi:uncharacterized protein (DUF433 family)